MDRPPRGRWLRHTVALEEGGNTVQEVIQGMGISRRMIQRLTRSRGIQLNDRVPYLKRKVREGDVLAVRVGGEERATLLPVEMDLEVVFEDADLLLLNKPAGLLVHPTSPSHQRTLSHGIARRYLDQGLELRVRPVHRLDRETSGLLLVAKSAYSHQHLDRQLRDGAILREYLALVEGRVESGGVIDAPISRSSGKLPKGAVSESGRPARTHFWVEERFAATTLIRARLESGRTHQLRIHLAHVGHPVAGDRRYGSGASAVPERTMLHAWRIAFDRPVSGERLTFEVAPPEEMRLLLERLRNASAPTGSGEADDHTLEKHDRKEGGDGGEIDPAREGQHFRDRTEDRIREPADQLNERIPRDRRDEP